MTLKKLISQHGWLNVEAALRSEYPAQQDLIDCYETVYHYLLLLPEAETDLLIELKEIPQEEPGSIHANEVEVYGKKQTPHVADAEISLQYALHFTPWAEWLAMPVSLKTLKAFSETEIIAHCLHAMTLVSFDEDNIAAQCKKLSESIENMNTIVPENQEQHVISWDQLIAQLNKEE